MVRDHILHFFTIKIIYQIPRLVIKPQLSYNYFMSKNYLTKIQNHIQKDKIYTIAFYGDSITSTEWVHPNWREIIEYVLKDYLGFVMKDWKTPSWNIRTINSALDGAKSEDLREKLDSYVLAHEPDLVILQGTRDDLTFNIGIKNHINNITSIIKEILNRKISVIFCGTNPSLNQEDNRKYSPYIKKGALIARQLKIKYVDLFNKLQNYDLKKFYTFLSEGNEAEGTKPGEIDPEHPNVLGNAYIAKILLKDIFGIEFDPELYIKDTLAGEKYPKYYIDQ